MSFQGDISIYKEDILKYCDFDKNEDGELWTDNYTEEDVKAREDLTDSEYFDKAFFSEHDVLEFLVCVIDKIKELEGKL
jgi:hypothetical protein